MNGRPDLARLQQAVQEIAGLPGVYVGIGPRRGIGAYRARVLPRPEEPDRTTAAISAIRQAEHDLFELTWLVRPHALPLDYRWFLENHGGLRLHAGIARLELRGLGPLTLQGYGSVLADDGHQPYIAGQVHIGNLTIGRRGAGGRGAAYLLYMEVERLDLAGTVTALSAGDLASDDLLETMLRRRGEDPAAHTIAASFTDLLDLAARTRGTLSLE